MSSLKNNLSNLRAKLQNIQVQIDEQTSAKAIKESKLVSIEERIKEIKENTNLININIGGKVFTTTRKTLLKDPNCLFAVLLNGEFKDSLPDNELFFDRSSSVFHHILNYMRSGKINYKQFSKEELANIYSDAEFYEITDIRDYLYERTKEILPVNLKFSGDYVYNKKTAGTNNIHDLRDESLMKGICATSPGWIELELNAKWEFDTLRIGGYKGDSSLWYSGNGAGAQILVSETGRDYVKVGNIPSKFAKEISEVKLDKKVTAKFIKFVHSSYLGIGYLEIEKNDEDL